MALDPTLYLLKTPFLHELLNIKGVTDISYNGGELFFVTNEKGRQRANASPSSKEVGDFLREIANLTERQFSYASPILDVSFGAYRLNAVNLSLARRNNEKTYTFSIRIASKECRIEEDENFFGGNSKAILLSLLKEGESLVIGGKTSSGKTELEKYLLSKMPENSRVIVIDNVEELNLLNNPAIDLTTWLVNERLAEASFPALIRNALRNNPDYIIVAEARGKEMLDALLSAMSGHPIITTIHARDIASMPERMARLAMLSSEKLDKDEILDDIAHHIRFYVYLEKRENPDGSLSRYLQSIGSLNEKNGEMEYLYWREEA